MGKGHEQALFKKWNTNDQQTMKKIIRATSHQGNANKMTMRS